jgi:predicted secreted protein
MAELGNNIVVTWNDGNSQQVIAGTRTNEINGDADLLEVCSATDEQWKHFITGRKSWTVNVAFLLLANGLDMKGVLNIGNTYTLYFRKRDGGGVYGSAILKTFKGSAPINGLSTGSFVFQGNGALTEYTPSQS